MNKFTVTANIKFEAKDLDHVYILLVRHFLALANEDCEDLELDFEGEIEIHQLPWEYPGSK